MKKQIFILVLLLVLPFSFADEFGVGNVDSSGFTYGQDLTSSSSGTTNNYYTNASSQWVINNGRFIPTFNSINNTLAISLNRNLRNEPFKTSSYVDSSGKQIGGYDDCFSVPLFEGWNAFGFMPSNDTDDFTDRNVSVAAGYNLLGYSAEMKYKISNIKFSYSGGSCYYKDCNGIINITLAGIGLTQNTYKTTHLQEGDTFWVQSDRIGNLTFEKVGGSYLNETYPWNNLYFRDDLTGEVRNMDDSISSEWVGTDIKYFVNGLGFLGICSDIFSCDRDQLSSWEGYFILAKRSNITMLRQDYNSTCGTIKGDKGVFNKLYASNFYYLNGTSISFSSGSGSGSSYNVTYAGLINNISYLSTYNSTYNGIVQNTSYVNDNKNISYLNNTQTFYGTNNFTQSILGKAGTTASPSITMGRADTGWISSDSDRNMTYVSRAGQIWRLRYDDAFGEPRIETATGSSFALLANGQNVFRAVDGWTGTWGDLVATTYIQNGRSSGNFAYTAYLGTAINRLLYIATNSQYTTFSDNTNRMPPPVQEWEWYYLNRTAIAYIDDDNGGNFWVNQSVTAPVVNATQLKLVTSVFPTCATAYKNTLRGNATGTYGCNSTDWVRLF